MKQRLPSVVAGLILGTIAVSGCTRRQGVTIVVDPEHAQVGQPKGKKGAKYALPPAAAITLDARHFDFSRSLYPQTRPTAVQLVVDNKRQYSAAWNPSGLVELSRETLTPMNGSLPFAGLRAGDQAIVAIGEQRLDRETREIVLKVLWVGLIEVSA
jgi:hypothetical protein